ncbi:MAG: RdgB/HAM1 family non-canonical purine NTP pyrophosphatase [bacterium]
MNLSHQFIIASHNQHKISEIRDILGDLPLELLSLRDLKWDIPHQEVGLTYYDNALLKAQMVVNHFDRPGLAEDSGLEVDALDGRPGLHTARYAGENASDLDNNRKLLQELLGVPYEKRTARYRCTIVLLFPDGKKYSWEGTCEGLITLELKGVAGFGYDPLFYVPEYRKTMAELGEGVKNTISHRARALNQFKRFFRNNY